MTAPSPIATYRAKRDFSATPEPKGRARGRAGGGLLFVVQKHASHRAGLHWDFRLEHDGALWSWAVPKGPSLDPAERRMAIHVEDHPIDYADFQGDIPAGAYGGGHVETWDRGTWQPLDDPAEGMRKGEIKFVLSGRRLNGRFTLVRLRNRDKRKAEAWFLIKGHDEAAREGADAAALERTIPLADGRPRRSRSKTKRASVTNAPAPDAVRGVPPRDQAPQLCKLATVPPRGADWLSDVKFDGYRLLAWLDGGSVRLLTRNGLDWTARFPSLAKALARIEVASALLDGEVVALRADGKTSFADLQNALSAGRDRALTFYAFDLLALNGWDLRPCRLLDRKQALAGLAEWGGTLRYSEHVAGDAAAMLKLAAARHLEGIVCKRGDASYRAGRGSAWLKLKCLEREELIVLGWTPPAGRRAGLGSLHLGYYDEAGRLYYAGGVGTGFSDRQLVALRKRLDALATDAPLALQVAGDPPDRAIRWVRPELVAQIEFTGWSGAGRVRHAVFLGLREDKAVGEVVRAPADRQAARETRSPNAGLPAARRVAAAKETTMASTSNRIVVAKAPKPKTVAMEGVTLTHPDRELWPGITKRDLAEYWLRVAPVALADLQRRPLSLLRCPEGVGGDSFFQKSGHGHLPDAIREGDVSGTPYIAIDDARGLVALAQISAIELHPWGATEDDPLHPDRLVLDLDPGEGVPFPRVVDAAKDVRARLQRLGLESFCRTTGGKGLHVVVPLVPEADWSAAKTFCRAFAETMAEEKPDLYVAHVKIADRKGRILIDWLRNGLGATAVTSYCPRARPGAHVATPLAWREVTATLDPAAFPLRSVPERLARRKTDPWAGFAQTGRHLPDLRPARPPPAKAPAGSSRIVTARKPAAAPRRA
jgi:bifunctional non-homologous end joining protein LigD